MMEKGALSNAKRQKSSNVEVQSTPTVDKRHIESFGVSNAAAILVSSSKGGAPLDIPMSPGLESANPHLVASPTVSRDLSIIQDNDPNPTDISKSTGVKADNPYPIASSDVSRDLSIIQGSNPNLTRPMIDEVREDRYNIRFEAFESRRYHTKGDFGRRGNHYCKTWSCCLMY